MAKKKKGTPNLDFPCNFKLHKKLAFAHNIELGKCGV